MFAALNCHASVGSWPRHRICARSFGACEHPEHHDLRERDKPVAGGGVSLSGAEFRDRKNEIDPSFQDQIKLASIFDNQSDKVNWM